MADYAPTGRWEVYDEYDANFERGVPVLVTPQGFVDSRWYPDIVGESEARGYADTYNMNEDKAAEFRNCPYCKAGCSWCGEVP
jgi:hypothetical protein